MKHSEHPLAVGEVITAPSLGSGPWIVIATRWAGGGHSYDGGYPDGWSVTLIPESKAPLPKRLTQQQTRYQDGTGCFISSVMLGAFAIVGEARRNKGKR